MVAIRINLGTIILSREIEEEWGGYPGWLNLIGFYLECHRRGDWGNLDVKEKYVNESTIEGATQLGQLISIYDTPGGRIKIITDDPFGNSVTTVSNRDLESPLSP